MAESPASQGRAAKRIKLAGRDSYGKIPKVFLDDDDNIVKMEFDIHDFPNLPQKRGEHFFTGTIKAHGRLWMLYIYPRGSNKSNADVEYVSLGLVYCGENTITDPVVVKGYVRTKIINHQLSKFEFCNEKGKRGYGWPDFAARADMIKNDCNEAGTLTVTVELQVATEKRSVWYPQLTFCDYTRLYKSVESSDVTVMAGTKEFQLHKCVLADRARVLFELVLTEESSSSSSSGNNNCMLVLADIDETVFEVLIRFVYSSEEPRLSDLDEETIKSILVAANRFGVTELKLYVESILIEKFLVPSKAAALLLFADAHICALLKETAMDAYMTDPQAVIASHSDWTTLQESNKLLTELLLYASAAGGRKRYSSYVRDVDSNDDTILEDVDDLDVTSLRERLQQEAKLDVDGSRMMLVERWKDYLMIT